MKLSKVAAGIALAVASTGFVNMAFANHFTVNGSENGSFTIHGTIVFGSETGSSISTTTFFPDNQSDADNPIDNGTPVTLGVINNGSLTEYSCSVGLGGSVVGGVASITSMSITSGGSGNNYPFCRDLVPANLPWRLHALSPGTYSAVLEGIGFYRAGVFTCLGVSVGVGVQPGYIVFGGPLKQGGCFLQTYNALTVTPSLDIVSN